MAANGGMNLAIGLDLSQLQKDLNKLHSELKTATPDQVIRIKAEFKKNRSDIRKEMKTLQAEMGKLVTVIPTDLQKREEYLKRLISLQQLYNETYSRSTAKGKQQLEYLQASLRMTQSALYGNNLLEKQAGILGKLGTLASRYFNIFAATAFGKKILDITGYFEQQKVALEGILGSAAKAETALQRIKSMALSSPKTTKELVGYTKQLAAYDVGESDPKKLLDTVHELAELSTGLGVDMQRLILAYGQVNTASVLRGQELRQFTEAGIPLVDKLAKKFSDLNGRLVTTGEVFELISKRQVSFEMVASVLSDMTKEGGKFYEMQSRITETTYGQKQKLKDIWDLELDKLGKDSNNILMGIIKALQSIVRNLKPIIIAISTLVTLKAIPNIIAKCIALSAQWKRDVVSLGFAWKYLKMEINEAKGFAEKFAVLQRAFGSGFGALGLNVALMALGAIVGIIAKAVQRSKEWKNTLNEINTSFSKDTARLTAGLDKLIGKLQTLNKNSREYKNTLDTLKSNYGDYINDSILKQLEQESSQVEKTATSWGKLSEAIKQAILQKQEYERHDSRRSAAIDNIIKSIDGDFNSAIRKIKKDKTYSEKLPGANQHVTKYREGYDFKVEDVNAAILDASRMALQLGVEKDSVAFKSILSDALKRNGISPVASNDIVGISGDILKGIKKAQGYDVYESETKYIDASLESLIKKRFDKATEEIENNYEKYTGKKDNGGSYNPFGIHEFSNNQYIGALRDILTKKEYQSYIPETFSKSLMKDADFLNAIKLPDADEGKAKAIATAITAFAKTLDDPSLVRNINTIIDNFLNLAGENGKDAARIRTSMAKFALFDGMNLTDKEKDYIKKWEPTDQNVKSNIAEIESEYQSMYDFNKKLGDKEGTFSDTYKENERLMAILDILAKREYYNQGSWLKKSGSGGSNGNYTRFFSDLFGMVKTAYGSQKNMIEGPYGVTQALIDEIQGLSDNNVLKGFYQKGKNPFQSFLDKIHEYDLETIFSAKDFEGLRTLFKEGIGIDKVDIADFEAIWNKLLEVIKNKAAELRKAGRGKEASKVEAYGQTMAAEYIKFFGKDEIEKKINEAIKSLQNIETASKMNTEMYRDIQEMMKTGNWREVWGLMNPGQEYRDRNEEEVAKDVLSSLANPNTAGGKGIMSFIGDDLQSILKAEQLGISFIPELYNIIKKINNIGKELKDKNGNPIDAKELDKTKDAFIRALQELIKSIKEETKKLSDTYTKQEKTTNKMYEAEKDFTDKTKLLNKVYNEGVTEIVDGKEKTVKITDEQFTERTTQALQDYTKSLTELLGGQFNTAIAQVTGDSSSATGSSSGGNFLQMLSSMQNGGLLSMINTGIGQAAASGNMSMGAAAGASGVAGGAIERIDMIIKLIYGAIKGIVEMAKSTLEVMKSFNDVNSIEVDKAGVMHIDTVYGGYNFEKTNAILDTIQQYNQHVMDGWEKAKSGDVIGSIVEIYTSITDLITSIREISDMDLQKKIEDLEEAAEDINNAATNLNAAAERMVGFDKIATQLAATAKSLEAAQNYQNRIDAERQKKLSDGDQMREWQQQYQAAMDEFLNGVRKLRDELVSSTEDWASTMGDAIRSAFQNGENAARAFRDNVKTMIGDVIEKMLQMAILEPLIENAIQSWTNSDYLRDKYTNEWYEKDDNGKLVKKSEFDQDNYLKELVARIQDPEKAEQFYQSMLMIGDTLIDTVDGINPLLKDFYMHNSELGTLSGGIESVTEDTARRIEALGNSQLGEVIAIRMLLDNYLSGGDGFGDSMMATIQASIASISSDTSAISRATDAILNHINELRTSPARPIHVTMS